MFRTQRGHHVLKGIFTTQRGHRALECLFTSQRGHHALKLDLNTTGAPRINGCPQHNADNIY